MKDLHTPIPQPAVSGNLLKAPDLLAQCQANRKNLLAENAALLAKLAEIEKQRDTLIHHFELAVVWLEGSSVQLQSAALSKAIGKLCDNVAAIKQARAALAQKGPAWRSVTHR